MSDQQILEQEVRRIHRIDSDDKLKEVLKRLPDELKTYLVKISKANNYVPEKFRIDFDLEEEINSYRNLSINDKETFKLELYNGMIIAESVPDVIVESKITKLHRQVILKGEK